MNKRKYQLSVQWADSLIEQFFEIAWSRQEAEAQFLKHIPTGKVSRIVSIHIREVQSD